VKLIPTRDAMGHVLCHDLTQIIPGETKDARFRKGHVVTGEDIPVLLSMGKEHLYVWEKQEGMLHENEAAERLWQLIKNEHIRASAVKEGKIEAFAETDGLLKVDAGRLLKVNGIDQVMIVTRHGDTPVKAGDKLAGTRVVPLVVPEQTVAAAERAAGPEPLLAVLPWRIRRYAVITTGSEVLNGRIKDAFTPAVEAKLAEYGAVMAWHETFADDDAAISGAIRRMKEQGADLVVCTGGMSVDPDDKTPLAIRNSGAEIVSYGAPVLPGAMFLLSYLEGTPVLGLPGCVMYARRTIFDLVLPRLMAGERLAKEDLVRFGQGGLCLECATCIWPNCGFGK